jgi:gliding motility-associated-like protein
MRKLILSICICLVAIAASAQLITASTGGISYTPVTGIDYVFMFNDINNTTEITYNDASIDPTNKTIEWYKFGATTSFFSGVKSITPDGDTGYILKVDGKQIATIWVVDYKPATLTSIEPEANLAGQCKNVNLVIGATVPPLSYQTQKGDVHNLPREFKIKYTTLKWGGTAWQPKDTTVTLTMPANQLSVPAPFCSTTYTLSGDQYAEQLGIPVSKTSLIYTPVAVICHETSILSTRDAKNEAERPTQAKQISGSAPLEMQFLSNANEPITQYYKWEIFKDKTVQPFVSRIDKDTRFTFSEAGTYKVRVAVSNANACSYSDSITVTVSESQIKVPNVFTPNGDGFNDEFRVAYKSIISFHCWVYNRWGRLVYEWTDPQKGWDGKISGKDASPGAYFYIINAVGSDAKKYKLKGDINLLRGTGN